MKSKQLTIVTPTFNRSNELQKLYQSLLQQDSYDFNWLIVDDGSTDDTKEVVNNFMNNYFSFRYVYKKNGGKHTAHNESLKYISTDLTMIVDSDDTLTPDAVSSILKEWNLVDNEKLCGLSFLKQNTMGEISGKSFPENKIIGNFIDIRINRNDISEKAEVWKTSVLKKYPFPEYENENYVPEGAIWATIGKEYDMLFINKIIYIYNYQEDGLTRSGRLLRLKNPKGGIFAAKIGIDNRYNLKARCKKMLLYICYSLIAKINIINMYKDSNKKMLFLLMFPFGLLLKIYWTKKYISIDS